jgi:pyruvate/2-oxoglutarate/acetoin dehydrogenase E1 component
MGLLIQSIRDNDPVIFCEHKSLYGYEVDVPEASYTIPFGEAEVVREGKDATIVSYGLTVHRSLDAAEKLGATNISAEVIDLRPSSKASRPPVASSSLTKPTPVARLRPTSRRMSPSTPAAR